MAARAPAPGGATTSSAAPSAVPSTAPVEDAAAACFAAQDASARTKLETPGTVVPCVEAARPDAGAASAFSVAAFVGLVGGSREAVRSLLSNVASYDTWLTLHPTYKSVTTSGSRAFTCQVGRPEADRGSRELTFDLTTDKDGVTWTVQGPDAAGEEGSTLTFRLAEVSGRPGECAVVVTQAWRLPGGLAERASLSDGASPASFAESARRHAEGLVLALDAAVREPPGEARSQRFAEGWQALRGRPPSWQR